MPKRFAVSSSNWSSTSTWDNGVVLGIPTASDDVWTNGQTVNIDTSFTVNSLNNGGGSTNTTGLSAPMVSANAIPAMTSNSTPEGAAFGNGSSGVNWQVFDGVASTTWVSSTTNTGSIGYQFVSPRNIKRYATRASSTAGQVPTRWTFEGSNDGTTYATLDTVTASLAAEAFYTSSILANTASFTFYRLNISAVTTAGQTPVLREIEMTESTSSATGGVSGGTYNFNSGSVSASITSATAPVTGLVATNAITVTAATGTVAISAPSGSFVAATTQLINHTGNCNLIMTASSFLAAAFGTLCINKSSTGTITLVGNVGALTSTSNVITFTAGNTVVIGNITGTAGGGWGINQSGGGTITVVGNVTGGAVGGVGIVFTGVSGSITGTVTGTANLGINTTGILTVTGNVIGGSGAAGIQSSNTLNVIGAVTAGSGAAGISTTSANTINVTGTVTATTAANGISSTSTGTVNLTGNMVNASSRQAIFSQNLFISTAATTQWRLFTPGAQSKILYSADTLPNLPTAANVRSGSLYGPSSTLSGSMVVPLPSDVRANVPYDNTVGTALSLTAADFLNEVSASGNAVAVRLRNIATDSTVGSLITGFNNGGF